MKESTIDKDSFPSIEKLNFKQLKTGEARKATTNKSLFAQNLEAKGKLKSFYALNQVHQPSQLKRDQKIKELEESFLKKSDPKSSEGREKAEVEKKQLITGEGLGNAKDAEQIHLENLERLAQMKPQEILNEREKLIQQLGLYLKIIIF